MLHQGFEQLQTICHAQPAMPHKTDYADYCTVLVAIRTDLIGSALMAWAGEMAAQNRH